ncbi:hypothetical protein Tco_0086179 [Tanacetum coccineum]
MSLPPLVPNFKDLANRIPVSRSRTRAYHVLCDYDLDNIKALIDKLGVEMVGLVRNVQFAISKEEEKAVRVGVEVGVAVAGVWRGKWCPLVAESGESGGWDEEVWCSDGGLDVLASAKQVEGSFKVPRAKVSSMMASMDEVKYRDSSRVTPSSRSSRSGDHRCSRRDSPEYDRGEGRVVSRYIVMIGIIKTIQNHHLVMDETTETMIIKEADMKVQGELLV